MIHVYYGNGKGKTTAATGLAVRAAGTGMTVYVVRFLKNEDSGELKSLRQLESVTVEPLTKTFGFTFQMTEKDKEEAKEYYTGLLRKAIAEDNLKKYDMLVMDEVNIAYHYDFIDKKEFIGFLKEYGQKKEIVITGANSYKEVDELADYITELRKVKHPYDKGVQARRGIEF